MTLPKVPFAELTLVQKSSLTTLLLMVLVLPMAVITALRPVRPHSQAFTEVVPTPTPSYNYELDFNYELADSPDWQTSENYLYGFTPKIKYHPETGTLGLKLDLYYEGNDLYNYQNLYLKSASKDENFVNLSRDPGNIIHYVSPEFAIPQGNSCYDIFTAPQRDLEFYRGTFCIKGSIITPDSSILYSPNATIFVNFNYRGDRLGAMTMGVVFNRRDYFNENIYNNRLGEKSVYFIYDYEVRNASFTNIIYTVDAPIPINIPESLIGIACGTRTDPYLKPQLHRTFDRALPQGGEFIDYSEKTGFCSFKYQASRFLYGYLSHTPLVRRTALTPTPTPTNIPIPTATPVPPTNTPTPTSTPRPTATPTSTPIPTVTPTNTPRPTATPTYIPASCTGINLSQRTITKGTTSSPQGVAKSGTGSNKITAYRFNFRDGYDTGWVSVTNWPGSVTRSHTYTKTGSYQLEFFVRLVNGQILGGAGTKCALLVTVK